MDAPQTFPLHEIPIFDEADYLQADLELLQLAKQLVRKTPAQAVVLNQAPGLARLFNLTRWQPDGVVEYLDRKEIAADVVIHMACHQAIHQGYGSASRSSRLLGEAIASASDLYLVATFAALGQEPLFLEETLESYTFYYESYGQVSQLETLLADAVAAPAEVTADLARFLFDFAAEILNAEQKQDLVSAELAPLTQSMFYPLVHHYHVSNWLQTLKGTKTAADSEQYTEILKKIGRPGWLERLLNSGEL